MINKMQSLQYKKENLLYLRRYLGLTQKSFIKEYLTDDSGKAIVCASTLSNLETKGGAQLDNVIAQVSLKLDIGTAVFDLYPESFIDNIDTLLPFSKPNNPSEPPETNVEVLMRQLTNYFAEQVFEGKLKAGGRIDSDRNLAEKFNVSRTAIRETLKVLYVMGMVDICPSQGSFLCKDTSSFFIIPLSWSIFLSSEQTSNILELRNTLEIEAAQMAANCTNNDHLSKLIHITYLMHSAYERQNFKEFLKIDLRFHEQIAICSENPIIHNLTQTLSNLINRLSSGGMANFEQLSHIYDEHQRIYGFIIAHDSVGAGAAMQAHLENSVSRY